MSSVIVSASSPLAVHWLVYAQRYAEVVPMTPKRIPFCGSRHEAEDRLRLLLATDESFARKWRGWTFVFATTEGAVVNKGWKGAA